MSLGRESGIIPAFNFSGLVIERAVDEQQEQQTPSSIQDSDLKEFYRLRFDGASGGNPGQSGASAVIRKIKMVTAKEAGYESDDSNIPEGLIESEEKAWCFSEYLGPNTTNNEAEYHGLIFGLTNLSTKIDIENPDFIFGL